MEQMGSKAEDPGLSSEVFDIDITNKTVENNLCSCPEKFESSRLSENSTDGHGPRRGLFIQENIDSSEVFESSSVDQMPDRQPSGIELCRKVLPELHEEGPCCSICLDEFTEDDPSMATTCGHGYHLQCIMQWAQRSRECPLCFHTLHLEVGGEKRAWPLYFVQ